MIKDSMITFGTDDYEEIQKMSESPQKRSIQQSTREHMKQNWTVTTKVKSASIWQSRRYGA
jgi:hypothetical protein